MASPVSVQPNHMLGEERLTAYFNDLVPPHLDYAEIVWGDQPGLATQMKQLRSFQSRIAKRIVKGKVHQLWL